MAYNFIRSLKQDFRLQIMMKTTSIESLDSYLEENPDVVKKRNYYLELLKILKSSEKVLKTDDEYILLYII